MIWIFDIIPGHDEIAKKIAEAYRPYVYKYPLLRKWLGKYYQD
jgi:hypothetical protein